MKGARSIIIVPETEKGKGGGHLVRCIKLTRDLRKLNINAFIFIPPQTRDLTKLYSLADFNPKWCLTNAELKIRRTVFFDTFEYIILDRFKTPIDELSRWKKIAPVIGIDEGGDYRSNFDFLIDILIPQKLGKPRANIAENIAAPAWRLNRQLRPEKTAYAGGTPVKIIITFGQEDAAGLGLKTVKKLSILKERYPMDITFLRGALSQPIEQKRKKNPENVRIVDYIPQLSEHLGEYDLVITHYGITAYEALNAGAKVLLGHPTSYHKKLAKAANFAGVRHVKKVLKEDNLTRTPNANSLFNQQPRPEGTGYVGSVRNGLYAGSIPSDTKYSVGKNALKSNQRFGGVSNPPANEKTLAALCESLKPNVRHDCRVCGAQNAPVIARFSRRTYRRCSNCGAICMDRFEKMPIEYSNDYFFESYKNQYGKTYLEDFQNIKEAGKRRIKIIESLLAANVGEQTSPEGKTSLLDIGCAYGPFLAAAKEAGFTPYGIEPSEDAVSYVQTQLGLPAVQGFFPPNDCGLLKANSFNVVTMWFVIEHFEDCARVLSEIKKLIKTNGIFAFSTPSFSGISGKKNLNRFLFNSPADHWTVWSPKILKKALGIAGFKLQKIVITGHHPVRFPLLGKLAKNKKWPVYRLLLAISKMFGMGDTMEVYAQVK